MVVFVSQETIEDGLLLIHFATFITLCIIIEIFFLHLRIDFDDVPIIISLFVHRLIGGFVQLDDTDKP